MNTKGNEDFDFSLLPEFSTVPETAKFIAVSPKSLWNWIGERRITVTRFGKSVRVPRREILRLVVEGTTPRVDSK